jgi:sialate O-acetylesterase
VVWYQGEQNTGRGFQYRKLLPALIQDWRSLWKQGDFPFLIVQLPNFGKVKPDPTFSLWAELREAQTMALAVPNTFLAVTIDVGEDADVHPKDKKTVGQRLARIAAKNIDKLPLVEHVHGPTFKAMKVEGDAVRIEFEHAQGLKTKDGKAPTDFAICGADRKFVWADAAIDGESVIVRAAKVLNPVAIRYAWADAPHGNLYNADNLPAAPFRTDDFPTASRNNR